MSYGDARRERKVVTVLFCDLVGFTARAEEMDPEDVAAVLAPYQARLREELERFGGTVEKFIGDAVMALFGAPVAHEDDPERAVRAALAIRAFAEEKEIELRIGIATGEALVTLGARPDAGETMATGDVVNTAARLEAAAPVNGILVGEKTHAATKHAIEYADPELVDAKGKAQPIRAWRAVRGRGFAHVERVHGAKLVGRGRELDLLAASLIRAREERNPQLVTLVGVPGIGKSRLVLELFDLIEADPLPITWRHGRCLPYGEGVTFWALGEMVKAEAGILETDSPEETKEKLAKAVDDERVRSQLRPLVGLVDPSELVDDRRSEAFAAWRAFFEKLAEAGPLVLVFEDLHWADEALLDFIDHLVDWAGGVPVLVVCTARPELLGRRPAWGGGKPNALTVSLSPLSDEETARLIAELLQQAVLEAGQQSALLARAEGNPLYAEQYVRLLRERGEVEELPLPETVQGIIAARLDGLPPREKALLGDAAVLGRTFPLNGLAAITGDDVATLEELLHGLERKEFVRRERGAARADDTEYMFRHVLVRDVAYGQIPRAERAEKHRLTAEWIDALGRPDDHAELLAHHYSNALDLARAAGQDVDGLREAARRALVSAGNRASDLNAFGAAARFYQRGLELTPADDPERAMLLLRCGAALRWGLGQGEEQLAEAHEALVARGDASGAAEAAVLLGDLYWSAGRRALADEYLERAASLVRSAAPSRATAYVVTELARFAMLAGRSTEAVAIGREGLALAERLALDDLRSQALNSIGSARVHAGDREGVTDVELSLEIALAIDAPREILRAYNNLMACVGELGDIRRERELWPRALAAAERFGEPVLASSLQGNRAGMLCAVGEWSEALSIADEFIAGSEKGVVRSVQIAGTRRTRAFIRFARGDTAGAFDDLTRALEFVQAVGRDEDKVSAIGDLAFFQLEAGDSEAAARLADEAVAVARATTPEGLVAPTCVLLFVLLGRTDELSHLVEQCRETLWLEAARHALQGRLDRAADLYHEMEALDTEASVRLHAAEQLLAEGRRAEADVQLAKAVAFYRRVDATRYVRQAEALLAAAS